MAVEGGEDEAEYESDPEESVLPLAMRRREASDDEEGEEEEEEERRETKQVLRAGIGSDGESDGQGGAPGYEDEESEIEEEEEEEEEEGEEVEEEEEEVEGEGEGEELETPKAATEAVPVVESGGEAMVGSRGSNQGADEEKKESEPFAVPTAGAFYMHDDRFRDNGGGRHRRTPGGRKLWESKDNREWVHDRFEELNLQDARYDEERRNSKGHFRGRGKYRGSDHGYVRGNRSRVNDDNNNQNRNFKTVRGRGPRRYEPSWKKNSMVSVNQNKQSGKILDTTSNAGSGRTPAHTSNSQPDTFVPRKHVFASSLSSASPPFYPSRSSNSDVTVTQKRDAQTGGSNRNLQSSLPIEKNFSTPHSSTLLRGKTIVDPTSHDRLYAGDSIRPVGGKQLNNLQSQSSGSSSLATLSQTPQSRVQERGLAISGQLNHQPTSSPNQVSRGLLQSQLPVPHQRPVQNTVQPSLRASTQQMGQRIVSGALASSPPQAPSINSSDVGENESPPGSSKSRTALVGKGKASIQGSGRGSFLYSGAQVIGATGAMGVAHGDQNFPGTPALLPVMQFGGQHNGGLGVPAVGMALPGYVAQPQLGFGNSEMTWVPMLAGAAGALGATYCPPYITVDGGYYGRPSGQTSLTGSKEAGTNKPNNASKPPQRPEIVNDEFGQRQNKPRRYSEMNFGQ